MFTDKIFINCEQCESNLQNLKSATIGEYSGWNFRDFVVTQIKIFKIFSSSQPRSVQWQNLVVRPKKGEKKNCKFEFLQKNINLTKMRLSNTYKFIDERFAKGPRSGISVNSLWFNFLFLQTRKEHK
jgi:hypothetical protein